MKPGSTVKHVVCQDTLVLFDGPGLQSLFTQCTSKEKKLNKGKIKNIHISN